MILIYDFDGTLTTNPLPEFEILKDCGCSTEELLPKIKKLKEDRKINFVEAYITSYIEVIKENNLKLNEYNLFKGYDKVKFNKGVLDYFNHFQSNDIKHYVVTSGFKDYVEKTKVKPFLTKVYGTTLKKENDEYIGINTIVTDDAKAEIISQIVKSTNKIIVYFGDGLSDKAAFKYVHSLGGKTIFIAKTKTKEYVELNNLGIIDHLFEPDFSENSAIYKYVQTLNERSE